MRKCWISWKTYREIKTEKAGNREQGIGNRKRPVKIEMLGEAVQGSKGR
jgi:hypothetical protein